jgi:hypothetical protein
MRRARAFHSSGTESTLMEIPLTAGVVAGGVVTVFAPLLAALGALAALVAEIKLEIIRVDQGDES